MTRRGVKERCSPNDPKQMSLSQTQTAPPKPFRIKLGHTLAEKRESGRLGGGEGNTDNRGEKNKE